jgi:hypothetical protein
MNPANQQPGAPKGNPAGMAAGEVTVIYDSAATGWNRSSVTGFA